MGLIDKFAGLIADRIVAKRQTQPEKYERHSVTLFPRQSEAGVFMTDKIAKGVDVVAACTNLLANTCMIMPAHVFAARGNSEDDGNQRLADHPVELMLQQGPNPEISGPAYRHNKISEAILQGNSYSEIERDAWGRAFRLWPIEYDRVQPCRDPVSGALYYEVDNGSASKVNIAAEDMLHLAGPTMGVGTVGMPLIAIAAMDLGEIVAQKR